MSGASLSEDRALTRIDAYKDDVVKLISALESPEGEEHAQSAREGVADAYEKIATLYVYAGNEEEAEEYFEKATEQYMDHVDAIVESSAFTLGGPDDARALLDVVEVAILGGDPELRVEASEYRRDVTAADAEGADALLTLSEALAALVLDADVEERLDAIDADGEDVSPLVAGATEALWGIHEADRDRVVDGIEAVLQSYVDDKGPDPYHPVCLDALALYGLARERSLVAYQDISDHREFLPDYTPER